VRTDRKPLTDRFGRLGDFTRAHWQGWVLGKGTGRADVPGPTDTAIQAVIELAPHDAQALAAAYSWTPAPTDPTASAGAGLRPFLPPSGTWQTSERFTDDIVDAGYHGKVFFHPTSRTVFLDVNTF
jgi:hypothetical protein